MQNQKYFTQRCILCVNLHVASRSTVRKVRFGFEKVPFLLLFFLLEGRPAPVSTPRPSGGLQVCGSRQRRAVGLTGPLKALSVVEPLGSLKGASFLN